MTDRFEPGQLVRIISDSDNGPASPYIGIVTHVYKGQRWYRCLDGSHDRLFAYELVHSPYHLLVREKDLEPVEDDDSREVGEWTDLFNPTEELV